jgi:hypothetical protein
VVEISECRERLKAEHPEEFHHFDIARIGEISLASAAWISTHARA